MEKTKRTIIIGSLVFLAIVIVVLAISLPIALKDRQTTTTLSTNNSNITVAPIISNISTSTTAELTSNAVVNERRLFIIQELASMYKISMKKSNDTSVDSNGESKY